MPTEKTLTESLSLLETVDLRAEIPLLSVPFLRLYGRLDSLVPSSVNTLMTALAPQSDKHVFLHASHAPFISHADDFFEVMMGWLTSYFPDSIDACT
jgi:pimeloyl-[acyl-carrier protein] methyl ester esterase